jgi:succinoglycan biosynthesis transport protein ExoP
MTHRDDSPHTPDTHHSLVGEPHHQEGALMVQPHSAPATSLAIPTGMAPATQDVLRGGMNANNFFHSLRRRWMLALGIGVVVGASIGIALLFIFPESSLATALFEVSNEKDTTLSHDYNPQSTQDFEILKKTQLALLKQRFLLTSALVNPGISSLSILAGVKDKEEWLQDHLDVEFPQNGEILSISLSGSPQEDLVALVNAVAEAYKKEVLGIEKFRKQAIKDMLERALIDLNDDITRKFQDYYDIAKGMGRQPGNDTQDPETQLLLRQLADNQTKIENLTTAYMQLETDYRVARGELNDPELFVLQADELIKQDPQYQVLQQQLLFILANQAQNSTSQRRGSTRSNTGNDPQVDLINRKIDLYRDDFKKKMVRDMQNKPNVPLQQLTQRFKYQASMMQQQLVLAQKTQEKNKKELENRLTKSVELETGGEKLKQLQQIANDMNVKLEGLDIDLRVPSQIRPVQPAMPTKSINAVQHYAIAIFGGFAGFALTCLGIAYLEFRNRKLNGPEEVDEGLGIRVVGTLPLLSSRKALDPNHPIVAQLTESIDGVRTILMHDSSSKRRQVVLITSAATMEGRTTVASQLAASLARAGRRTLLIDGDLRRPALHALFDAPLEDGLCEVLRAEVDVADVIRPTHAEGLWLLTAGYCDVDAIHALATEQMQPVFDKLRNEYDFIIIDGAPILGMSDALIFGQYSDGAILSVRRDHSQMPKINHAAELLRGVGIRIIGAVVNGVQTKADDRIVQMRLIAPKAERELQPTA